MPEYVPDYKLEPPDDSKHIAFHCECCEEPIYEGEDYWCFPGWGYCCERCIDSNKHYDAQSYD